jgi:hypothetical protein
MKAQDFSVGTVGYYCLSRAISHILKKSMEDAGLVAPMHVNKRTNRTGLPG